MDEILDGSICALHLTNGTTIVARIDEQNDDGFVCWRPMEFTEVMTQQGPARVLIPYLSMGGVFPPLEVATIPYEMVVMPRQAPEKIEAGFRETTGLLAVVAKPSLIIPA